MKRLLIFLLLFLFSCLGGGNNPTAPNPNKPVLNSLVFEPSTVSMGSIRFLKVEFTFTDMNGDLGGGFINYNYEGKIVSVNLPLDFTGLINGKGYAGLNVIISNTKGSVPVLIWLTDLAGNDSEKLTVFITQV